MEQINNEDTIKECSLVLGHQVESAPMLDTSKIQLVANINPKDNRIVNICRNNASSSTGTLTIYTTPTDRDFYLTGLSASWAKDVTCDTATGNYSVAIIQDGATRSVAYFSIITLTAQSMSIERNFTVPIKIDRGTSISITGSFTAGALSKACAIQGYLG